jgi:hypothetical protein
MKWSQPASKAQQLELAAPLPEHDHGQAGVGASPARADRPQQRERAAPLAEAPEHEQPRAVVAELDARLLLGLGAERLVAVGGQVVKQERTGALVALGDEQRRRCVVHPTLLSF